MYKSQKLSCRDGETGVKLVLFICSQIGEIKNEIKSIQYAAEGHLKYIAIANRCYLSPVIYCLLMCISIKCKLIKNFTSFRNRLIRIKPKIAV